jgi:hypothetical protein
MIDSFFELVRDNAKCYNHPNPDEFFDYENNSTKPKVVKFCDGCKLRTECFDYAIIRDVYGVWGGTTRNQRKIIQKHYKIKPITLKKEIGIE